MTASAKWRPAGGDGARRRPRHAHAAADQRTCPSRWCASRASALIDHVLDRLAAAGVARAVVNVHYMADQLEAHLKQRKRRKS